MKNLTTKDERTEEKPTYQELLLLLKLVEKRLDILKKETPSYMPFPMAAILPEIKSAIQKAKRKK